MRHIRFLAPMLWLTVLASLAHAQVSIPIKRVTASSSVGPNLPTNTLSPDADRWEATGRDQYIQFEFADGFWDFPSTDIHWAEPSTIINVETQHSADGITWYSHFIGKSQNLSYPHEYPSNQDQSNEINPIRFVRILRRSKDANATIKIRAVQFFGIPWGSGGGQPPDALVVERPSHTLLHVAFADGTTDFGYELDDDDPDTSLSLNAHEPLTVTIRPYDNRPNEHGPLPQSTYTRCIGVLWKGQTPVPFRMNLITLDYTDDGESVRMRSDLLVESEAAGGAFQVFAVPSRVQQDPYANEFEITPTVPALLAEVVFLHECHTKAKNTYPYEVLASAWDGTHYPGNTLDRKSNTRWSAVAGQAVIEYGFRDQTFRQIGIQWFANRSNRRISTFDVEVSLNGLDWYPALTGGQSRGTQQLEWYDLDQPTFGRYLRIVGHGNDAPQPKQARWTSIREVRFRTPPQQTNLVATRE